MDFIENETQVWGFNRSSSTLHAFIGGTAMCRNNITSTLKNRCDLAAARQLADEGAMGFKVCKSCEKKYLAMVAREEASVQPVNPYDQVCEGVVTEAGAAQAAGDDEPREKGRPLPKLVTGESRPAFPEVASGPTEATEARIDAICGQSFESFQRAALSGLKVPSHRPPVDTAPCSDCSALKAVAYRSHQNEPFCADCVALHDRPPFSFEPGWAVLEHGRDEHRIDISEVSTDLVTGEMSGPYAVLHELFQCGLAEMRDGGLYWLVSPDRMTGERSDDPVEQALAGVSETGQRIITVEGTRFAVGPMRYGRIWTGSNWRTGNYFLYWAVAGRTRVSGPRVADVFGFSGPDGLFEAAYKG